MGRSRRENIDVIVTVDPHKYYEFPYNKKSNIARIIGKINDYYKHENINLMLIVPGRIGTSSPELGIPVTFADISDFFAILEVSYSEVGYVPELSFGSHLFQDLVEADIFYGALFEDETRLVYDTHLLDQFPNQLKNIDSTLGDEIYEMVDVVEIKEGKMEFYYDMKQDEAISYYEK